MEQGDGESDMISQKECPYCGRQIGEYGICHCLYMGGKMTQPENPQPTPSPEALKVAEEMATALSNFITDCKKYNVEVTKKDLTIVVLPFIERERDNAVEGTIERLKNNPKMLYALLDSEEA
jgi:hypothetical protein